MDLFKESDSVIIFKCESNDLNLEEFLYKEEISGRLFRRLYKSKNIYVNGKYIRKSLKLKKGDIISLYMEDEIENIKPEPISIDIVFEDNDLLILNKPPNIVVHPTKSHQTNTLSNGIANYFLQNNIFKKIRFVNRLDMDTTGILIVAKNSFAHQQMAIQFEENTVVKKYLTIVKGKVEIEEAIINEPIGREEDKSIKKVVHPQGQESITKYKVLETYTEATLLEVQIFTGRSHQIRVHLEHIGHPIIGDILYNEESPYINRQALHSSYLKAKHPRSKEDIQFYAPLPEDMNSLIKILKV